MRKYYLIYKDDIFIGYADDKIILKQFLDMRKSKYHIEKVYREDIPNRILDTNDFDMYALTYYQGYRLTNELPIFIYDISKFEELIRNTLYIIQSLTQSCLRDMKYIKDDNIKNIEADLVEVLDIIDSVIDYTEHEPIYDEVFDVELFFNHVYAAGLIK